MSRARKHDYKGIAALGRGEDTMLVHMTPREVQSLQDLAAAHGGSLTVNPDTGYPEAGWLSSLLPIVAGIGASILLPGIGTLATAGLSGATSALATGVETGFDLKKMGIAGLTGAIAGGSAKALGSGLQAAANPAAGAVGAAAPLSAVPGAASAIPLNFGTPLQAAVNPVAGSASAIPLNLAAAPVIPNPTVLAEGISNPTALGRLGNIGKGVENLYKAKDFSTYGGVGGGGGAKLLSNTAGTFGPIVTAGLSGELSGPMKDMSPKNKSPYEPYVGPYSMQRPGGGPTEEELAQYYASNNTGNINYFPGQNTFTSPNGPTFTSYAEGGIASLPGPQESAPGAVEGMLSGPGDGMSDSIPANIDGKQEARLADGEFVIPADVVSHIGNGSSKSGSQRLYAMMDAIREARTGNPAQGKQINANEFLPA